MDPNPIAAGSCDPLHAESPGHVMPPSDDTLAAFGLADHEPVPLPGGEERAYRVGDAILKQLRGEWPSILRWTADLHAAMREDGFRVARPRPLPDGGWLTADGWSAWTFLDGHHD